MKKNWKNSILLIILLPLFMLASCSKSNDHVDHDVYTCPMHPTVASDKPGMCPVCGMDLVRKARQGEEIEITEDLANAIKAPNQSVIASIETIKPLYQSISLSVKATGVVTYDTRKIHTISARTAGRVEKIFLKYEKQRVRKGQKVVEMYSPELVAAQRELLYVIENDPRNDDLIEGAKNKLTLLGFSTPQLHTLVERKVAGNTFSIYSPYDGYVITSDVSPSTIDPGSGKGEMSPSANTSTPSLVSSSFTSAFPIREGNYVSAGQALFEIVNTNAVRIELNLIQEQIGIVKLGDKVEIDMGNGTKEMASVDFVQPFFNEGQNFLKIRLYTNKIEALPIGQLVQANIELKSKESLWVPKLAVIDLGNDKIVFIKDRETFKPKKITAGIRSAESVEVKNGLATSDEIASNAQYLVDSESFIKPMN